MWDEGGREGRKDQVRERKTETEHGAGGWGIGGV